MPLSSLGIIGLGKMAQAIVLPLVEKDILLTKNIFGVVGSTSSIERVKNYFSQPISVSDSKDPISENVWNYPVKLLSVKPQNLNLINEKSVDISSDFKPLMISILAGVSLATLQEHFPNHTCVRTVPNTPSLVGSGLTGVSWGRDITKHQKEIVNSIFKPISEIVELPEIQLDAFLALTSSGPAYVALFVEALADGAVAAGLPRKLSLELANKTLAGSVRLMQKKGIHPGELKDMVASPNGTTIAALRHLEMSGLRSALIEAVVLAAERSRQLS